jgi:hypothetical protein
MRELPRIRRVRRLTPLLAALLAHAVLSHAPASANAKVVWLCKPGQRANPCEPSLTTTLFSPSGQRVGVEHTRRPARPKADCFYVYPTVSDQQRPQATRVVDDVLRSVALYQAARYSRDCRVFAPVYRQITIQGLAQPQTVTPAMEAAAYGDVVEAWRTYLRRFNKGRGVVLISHSQGTFVLRRLIRDEIDPKRAVRRRLVTAVLMGGNVAVKKGSDRGGDFKNLRACRRPRQVGCIMAFSSFNAPVPPNALFGRNTDPTLFGQTIDPALEVLCTNPAALGGGSGRITPVYPTKPFAPSVIGTLANSATQGLPKPKTLWSAFPRGYRARCSHADGASVLQISPVGSSPLTITPTPDATWGTHLADGSVALGTLVDLVRRQIEIWGERQQ